MLLLDCAFLDCKIMEFEVKHGTFILTGDHASSAVWPAPFASLYSDAVSQPISHALQAQDRPLFPC